MEFTRSPIQDYKIDKGLLHFACYHHIIELLAGAALTTNFKPTSLSKLLLFKRFKKIWFTISPCNFSISTDEEALLPVRNQVKEEVR